MEAKEQIQKEKQMIDDAKKRADAIIKEAEEAARIIYASSLEYVDDMLAEVQLITLRAKESMRIQSEVMMEEFDSRISIVEEHKQQLLEMLQSLSENGQRPIKKASYNIKVDEAYLPRKKEYAVRTKGAAGEGLEVHKPAKAAYEIKIADEWKDRVEAMLENSGELIPEEPESPKADEAEEEEDGFKASDFDLDGEYFSWLEEEEVQKSSRDTKKNEKNKKK